MGVFSWPKKATQTPWPFLTCSTGMHPGPWATTLKVAAWPFLFSTWPFWTNLFASLMYFFGKASLHEMAFIFSPSNWPLLTVLATTL